MFDRIGSKKLKIGQRKKKKVLPFPSFPSIKTETKQKSIRTHKKKSQENIESKKKNLLSVCSEKKLGQVQPYKKKYDCASCKEGINHLL